jgi:hypothetical protein
MFKSNSTLIILILSLVSISTGIQAQNAVVINEIMASNTTTQADNVGEFDDWIELYNNSSVTIDLDGWHITDKPDNLTKYDIPSGTSIDANDYLIIWADEDSSQGPDPVHANFKLSKAGEAVILIDNFGIVADSITFGQQTDDMGYARVPNGTGNFVIQTPTFNGNNETSSSTVVERLNNFKMFPNPANGLFNIVIDGNFDFDMFEVFDVQGRKVDEMNITSNQFQVDASTWGSGLYVLKYGDTTKRILILK